MKSIRLSKSIEEGLNVPSLPFVARSIRSEFPDRKQVWERMRQEERLEGYVGPDGDMKSLPTENVIESWATGTLGMNVLSQPAPLVFAPAVIRKRTLENPADLCSYVLTRANNWTDFHCDQLAGEGEWMFLYEGQKMWYVADASSRVYAAFCGAGDFIYFPATWRHAVKTIDKTFGVGGFC